MSVQAQPALRAQIAGAQPDTEEWRVLRAGFDAVVGYSRLLLYDLALSDAPGRLTQSGITLRGSPRWRAYLSRRRGLDDGGLTLIVSLRRLADEERMLAVDWGTAHANSFLLVEPLAEGVDLTAPEDRAAQSLRDAARAARRGSNLQRVESLLRETYGSWVYWPEAPATTQGYRQLSIPLNDGPATLFERLQNALRRVFPPRAFREQLRRLLQNEAELFSGRPVERARSPFLTRLGLPVIYDPSLVTGALRGLVNDGLTSAFPTTGGYFLGPDEPLPDGMPNELFERMLL